MFLKSYRYVVLPFVTVNKMAIATPNTIGGYDYSFVDTPHDRYICNICHLPSKDPCVSECCGH